MAMYIYGEKCVSCGACAYACPVQAIEEAGVKFAVTDEEVCVDCGVCTSVCLLDAIFYDKQAAEAAAAAQATAK